MTIFQLGRTLGLASFTLLAACSSITIVQPKEGSTNINTPQRIEVSEQGFVAFGDVYLDGFNMSAINGSHYQMAPNSTLHYVEPGRHKLWVQASDYKTNDNISETSTFDVAKSRLWYSCPVGTVHPALGQCCVNGACDSWGFGNFGPALYGTQKCQEATFPGSSTHYYDMDCIRPGGVAIGGTGTTNPQMFAVSFSLSGPGTLTHIRVPIGWTSGQNGAIVAIATDANGNPGTILETISVANIRPQPTPTTVDSPFHVFSIQRPLLQAGKHWLVIAPAAADTIVQWNHSLDDFSIPAATTLLVNDTTSNVGGPWRPVSNLVVQRPAFEVDFRF